MNDLAVGFTPACKALLNHVTTTIPERWDAAHAVRQFKLADIRDVERELARSSTPLATVEPKLNGALSNRIANPLRMIGMKLNPTMSDEQCRAWLKALLASLSDLPPHIARKAADEALHHPFRFFPEVDVKLREIAAPLLADHKRAIGRINAMLAELDRAARPPQPQIEEQCEPLSTAEVQSLQRSGYGKSLIRIGIAKGWIDPNELPPLEGETDHE